MSQQPPAITITQSAGNKISAILAQSPEKAHFRVQIKGGGCTGFEYVFGIDHQVRERDIQQPYADDFLVLIDPISFQYVKSAKIDYRTDTHGERFIVDNPNAQVACSCGSSFSPKEDNV